MSDDSKIFIDEDWKAQVQREREQAAAAAAAAPAATPAPEPMPEESGEIVAASFTNLIGSLASQCMLFLGLIAPQGQKQVLVDLDQAQYLLDTLQMLHDKTKGNLTPEEDGMLTQALAELGDVYVARVQQFQEETIRHAGKDLTI